MLRNFWAVSTVEFLTRFQEGISRVYTSIMHSSEAYVGIMREGLQPMIPWVNSALFTAQRGAVFLFSTVLLVLACLRFKRFDPFRYAE